MSDTTYRLFLAGLAAGAIAMALAIIWFSRPPRIRRPGFIANRWRRG